MQLSSGSLRTLFDSFDFDAASPIVQSALKAAPGTAQKLMAWKSPRISNVENQWSMDVEMVGVYGTYYLKRAIMTQIGLGANLPEDAVYPIAMTDGDGNPLDGANNYVLHFNADDIPPVNAFWSVTIYDNDGYQVANSLNRFALSSWMPMEKNQTSMIGPNRSPTFPVPNRWIAKRISSTTTERGMMKRDASGECEERPSSAESTEMAGVMIPSPNRSAAPRIVMAKAKPRHLRERRS